MWPRPCSATRSAGAGAGRVFQFHPPGLAIGHETAPGQFSAHLGQPMRHAHARQQIGQRIAA
jgi:hypothetical protein